MTIHIENPRPAPARPGRQHGDRRNLVVLCDGTSNEVRGAMSNVLKLYRIARHDDRQVVYYQPGVGTAGLVQDWGRWRQDAATLFGLATGWGIDDHILDAYRFLATTYRPGDRIFLFGFSRGGYTACAVAGMIFLLGLLEPQQLGLAPYALSAYKRASKSGRLPVAWHFRKVIGGRQVPIDFLGTWDTVASVIVPGGGAFGLPTQRVLPYSRMNPGVRVYRGACAIDERRRFYRPLTWRPHQIYQPDPFERSDTRQDQRTVWFAGGHADIGGGWTARGPSASDAALRWMALEAAMHGLSIDAGLLPPTNATAPLHTRMPLGWRLLEYLPRNLKWKRWPERSKSWGWYLPLGEPRPIEEDSWLHRSVIERIRRDGYKPVNLPASYRCAEDADIRRFVAAADPPAQLRAAE